MNKKFIAFAVVLLVVLFAVQYRMPKRFEWNETYLKTDRQPFGCYVFDSVLSTSMPKGYKVSRKTLWQLNKEGVTGHAIIVSTPANHYSDKATAEQAFSLAMRGNQVLLFAHYNDWLADTLKLNFTYLNDFFSLKRFKEDESNTLLQWGDDEALPVHDQFVSRCIDSIGHPRSRILCKAIVEQKDSILRATVVSCPVGKGEVLICTTPLLCTNYAMLNDETRRHTARLLSLIADRPVIRTEALLTPRASQQESPFYLLLERPPLRWALNLTLLTILIFVIFTARRRQRAIPVMEAPQNHNMDFVRLIGTLYHQQGHQRELLRMKLTYAAEEIRRRTGTDPDESGLLDEIRKAVESQEEITDETMRRYIDQLNEIIKKL